MSTVITVENLGKKYLLRHQSGQQPYVALRDVIADACMRFGKRFASTLTQYPVPSTQYPSSEDFWALKDVSFEVKQGDRIGIIGRNGAGKSTLLKILSRITEPTTGSVRIRGRVASLLEVGTGFHPELTGRENIFLNGAILGMTRAEIRNKFDEIVAFAEIERFLDTPVKRFSSGMYVRLAFAVAAHLEPEILVVDEVLAVGDVQFQKKCLGKMEDVSTREGRTVLFVSHNLAAINSLCVKALLLDCGTLQEHGPIQYVVSNYLNKGGSLQPKNTFRRMDGGIIQYTSISINDLEGNICPSILEDKGFIIVLELEAFKDVSDVYLGLILRDSDGSEILFADSRDGKDCLQSKFEKGCYALSLKFPGIFKPGIYSVSLGIASTVTLEQLHSIDSACSFEFVQNSNMQRNAPRPGDDQSALELASSKKK